MDDYLKSLLQRADRAFQGKPIPTVGRVRAIVGAGAKMPDDAQAALDVLSNGEGAEPTPEQLQALEKAIRIMRPSLLSRSGQLPELEPDTAPIFPAWPAFSAAITPYMFTIGRIDLTGGRSIGTGFLVASNLLVTNTHVLDELSFGTRRLQKGQARVRFREEHNSPTEASVDIVNVVAVHPSLDMALLAVESELLAGRPVLPIDTAEIQPGEDVVAIGYPFDDKVRNPLFVGAVFGNQFGVKRAAPGEIIKTVPNALFHDCSTLGGNSGSPIISMASNRVIGIHHTGFFTYRNEALNGQALASFVSAHL
jgi:S1-C subfamily serine protease